MTDLRPFLRLQNDDWLTALRDKLSADLLANTRLTSISVQGKSSTEDRQVPTDELARQLAEILIERGLGGPDYVGPTRMTAARFV